MDNNANVPEVQPSNGASSSVRALTKIDPNTWSSDRLKWLWERLMTQDYAFDDFAVALGPRYAFLEPLFDQKSEWYEIGDDGIAVVSSILPKCNALVHFAVWGDVEPRELFQLQHLLFASVFDRWQLNRLTAYIPTFNKQAVRMATLAGFKFEGEIRKTFLKHGRYYNLQIYGILKSEFYARGVRN